MNNKNTYDLGCHYCDSFLRPTAPEKNQIWNKIVLKSEHFIVIPTIGMLIPGWLLILTKEHILNFATIPSNWYEELNEIKNRVFSLLTKVFVEPFFFEHGPKCQEMRAGSCVDHAHLHVIPYSGEITNELFTRYKFNQLKELYDLKSGFEIGGSYLYYETIDHKKYISVTNNVPSQFIRKLIAHLIQKNNVWNWAIYPEIENIEKTISLLEKKGIING